MSDVDKKTIKKIAVIGAKMYPVVQFTDLLIPTDETLDKVMMEPPDDIIPIEPPTKMGDANTQRQRVKKLVQSTGRIQPKTNIENDEAPPMRWRE